MTTKYELDDENHRELKHRYENFIFNFFYLESTISSLIIVIELNPFELSNGNYWPPKLQNKH